YVLDQLPRDRRAEVELALAQSPELQAEVGALRVLVSQIEDALAAEPALALAPAQREAVLNRAANPQESNGELSSPRPEEPSTPLVRRGQRQPFWKRLGEWRLSIGLGMAGACALAFALMLWPNYLGQVSVVKGKPPPLTPEERFSGSRYKANAKRVRE